MVSMTNREFSELLKRMSAAYQILNENRFKIIAYDRAADAVAHLTQELEDLWAEKKLDEIPGVGTSIQKHIDEYFRTGKIGHFDTVLGKLPASIYPLLLVPGIGPKKAFKLVTELKLTNEKTIIDDLENAAKEHKIAPIEGFGEKSEEVVLSGIEQYRKGMIKENRLGLPEADAIAQDVIAYMKKCPGVHHIDPLGSLRRQVSTIGDIDLAAVTDDPETVIKHFVDYPHENTIDQGEKGATIVLHNGRQVDLRVSTASRYGAMLQYFTGSKHHNIKLRTLALNRGLSLSEHGIKDTKTQKITAYKTEEAFYKAIGLPYIEPELREDHGEIEAAIAGKLPHLITTSDIKGDLHMHANYEFPSSHDLGRSPLSNHLDLAVRLGYEYIGIADHNPKNSDLSPRDVADIMKKREAFYRKAHEQWQEKNKSKVGLFILCEVDILTDGRLALPEEAYPFVDGLIVSVHSAFTQEKKEVTERILKALSSTEKVRIFGHPTGRLLSHRDGVDADWIKIMEFCKEHDIAMEINAYPDRLDLPDVLVHEAVTRGVQLTIDTDSHEATQMELMRYGVSVARRGWATKDDIINSRSYNEFARWLHRKGA